MSPVVEELRGLPAPHVLFAGLWQRPGAFLLESAQEEPGPEAYSIIGFEPPLTLCAQGLDLRWTEGGRVRRETGPVLEAVRSVLERHRAAPAPGGLPFAGGAVGYWSYEAGAAWENVVSRREAGGAADVELGFYDGALLYAHGTGRWFAAATPVFRRSAAEILKALRSAAAACPGQDPEGWRRAGLTSEPRPCGSREDYLRGVEAIRRYIASGDVYQVNLSHRFDAAAVADPYALYQRLRRCSPAPFASFLATDFGHIVSCSPERFLRVRGRAVETRPIKGTRPRGRDAAEDARLAAELQASPKERAELLMIVDLERNDLGRVCVPGSVEVPELYRVETHPTVFHLVATVTGRLRPEVGALDLLRAAFPGGSITGAPKIRAMQIIHEVEPVRRGVYTGSIGYLGFDGDCDLNIAIRTLVCTRRATSYHVGAGIVWDSDPVSEYEETLAKGRALRDALAGTAP
jgi:para-aminobenzoate synthetase component 1